MENKHVDIIILICCILGISIGMTISSYGTFIYNIIFYIFVIVGIYFCLSKIIYKY